MRAIQLHMTETAGSDGDWSVRCRCGWASYGHAYRPVARVAGDVHLAEANGWAE